jgi:two-component system OmpR family response regulator
MSNAQSTVLVAEDDARMLRLMQRNLELAHYEVLTATDGLSALDHVETKPCDLLLLDIMMPKLDGLEVCRRVREFSSVPIIMVTARNGERDVVLGLDAGADDYLTKPFSFSELLARLRALARRPPLERPTVLEVGDLRLDPATRQAWRGESEVDLSAKEFALLETLMQRPGQVLSRFQLLEHCWDYGYENRSNVVDVYVRYLREKIDRPFGRDSIETVRGAGYRLRRDGGA